MTKIHELKIISIEEHSFLRASCLCGWQSYPINGKSEIVNPYQHFTREFNDHLFDLAGRGAAKNVAEFEAAKARANTDAPANAEQREAVARKRHAKGECDSNCAYCATTVTCESPAAAESHCEHGFAKSINCPACVSPAVESESERRRGEA